MIDNQLLEILACPLSKAPLVQDGERLVSTDPETRRAYRVEDGIPMMLIDESEELSVDEHRAILEKHGATPWKKSAADSAGSNDT